MFHVSSSGSFAKTNHFLEAIKSDKIFSVLDAYGQKGVDLLSAATPIESGETAHSWFYEVVNQPGRHIIYWGNSHVEEGVNIAVILEYGHGTGTGGYVEGRDYINPALRPLFDKIIEDVWRQVTDA